ncbi:MAG: DHA2 family efflux MFS transporter permease subunit [Proteobacteria bacterium]|nr:MAG: DHA2 family efflux MFS transporter permease subunit [Pseudomonadota bacterium]
METNPQSDNKSNILLWLVAIGFFMETLDSTIVNTALPAMAKSLNESPLAMHSVILGYSLTLAIFIPASGWFADRFGTKRTFLSAILIFSVGSLLCALSRSLPEIVASRVIQGAGGSMLLPIGRLAILRAFPGPKFLPALSFVTIPGLIGPLIGPTLGGYLVEYVSWHWIFLINLPIGIIGVIATYFAMPDLKAPRVAPFDLTGFIQLSLGMLCLSLALDGLSELGFTPGVVVLLMFAAAAAVASYFIHATKVADPLFPLRLFRQQTYKTGIIGNLFARVGSSGMPFLIPLLLQLTLGYSAFQAGLTMLPVAISAIVAKRIINPIIQRTGYRYFLTVNTVLVGLSIASFALFSPTHPMWLQVIQLVFFGTVNSLQFTAMNTLTLKDVDPLYASSGNSLFSMVQMLAMSLAVATAGALLNTFTAQLKEVGSLEAFHATFLCMGAITCTSAYIFWQLPPETRTPRKPLVVPDVG